MVKLYSLFSRLGVHLSMLRLEPLFSLEKDVFPKIPRDHLLVPPKLAPRSSDSHGGSTFLNFKGAALSIIGRYNSDTLVVSYIGFYDDARTTFFSTYDITQSALKPIYRQRAVSMIGCTLNIQGSLIGFTYKTSKGSVAGVPDMYESCVAEVSDHGQCYRMTAEHVTGPTAESQWLHFLPHRASGSHLLIYIYNTHADLFAVYTAKKNGTHSITAHPHFRNKLAEHLCWFQWDEARSMIYILNVKKKKESPASNYVLRCIDFPDRKPVATFKRALEMDLQMIGVRAKDNMQVVRFGAPSDNAYCLCQQHANPYGNVIRVSVWIFHHDIKVDIDIPFVSSQPNFNLATSSTNGGPISYDYSPDYLARVKVFFDALGDLLVIYVPGVYLQLIDCAVDHEPTVNLILSGPAYNNPLPDTDHSTASLVETFEMRGEAKTGKRLSLLDRVKGLLYEYKLNQNTIVTATSIPDPNFHKQLLALALLHVQDEDTPESIMLNLLRKHPGLVSADLMKYFLLGAPYREYRKKNDVIHKKVASLIPIIPTAIPANTSTSQKQTNPQMQHSHTLSPALPVGTSSGSSSASHSPRSSLSSSFNSHSPSHPKAMAIPSATRRTAPISVSDSMSSSVASGASGASSVSSSSLLSPSFMVSSSIGQNSSQMLSSSLVSTSFGSSLLYSSPIAQSTNSDLGKSIARSTSPSQLGVPSSSSYSNLTVSPSSAESLSDSPNSLSGSSISLGSSWIQPDITADWSGYQLVQGKWPDHRSAAIQLPASIYLLAGPSDRKYIIQAKLWVAGKDPNDPTWQIEHLSGSPSMSLRSRETGSLPTLIRLFSEEDTESKEWVYLFQSNEGMWYRAMLSTCVDKVSGPGFSSWTPMVSFAASSASSAAAQLVKRLPRINLAQLDWQHVHDDYIPQQTVFKKLIGAVGRIFGSNDDAGPKEQKDEDYHDPRRLFITGAYCKHIFENISNSVKATRAECFEWASHYRSLQAAAVGKLYGFIHVCAGEMPHHLLFQVYSTFHEVLEELMLPVPNDFYTKYTVSGYFCLPRHIFVQYAEHGIFHLTRQFVEQLEVRSPEDANFKYLMLSYLPKEDALAVLRTMQPDGALYVAEEAVAAEQEFTVDVDLEEIPPQEFLPVGAYHLALAKKKTLNDQNFKFVCEATSKQFRKPTTLPSTSSGRLFFGSPSHASPSISRR